MRRRIVLFHSRLPRFSRLHWFVWSVALCLTSALLWHAQIRRPQGVAPPAAPSIEQWNAWANAPSYQVTEIPPFSADFPQNRFFVTAINNSAQVVGFCGEQPTLAPYWWRKIIHLREIAPHLPPRHTSGTRAFYWSRGRTDILPPLGRSRAAEAFFINDSGQIAGDSQPDSPNVFQNGSHRAVLWDNFRAAPRDVGAALAPATSMAFGLNEQGNVCVLREENPPSGGDANRAYLWNHGALQSMGQGRLLSFMAFGLNCRNEAMGIVTDAPRSATGANLIPIRLGVNTPPVILSNLQKNDKSYWIPYRHNDAGDMTGSENGIFLYQSGRIKNLWSPGSYATYDTRYVLNQNGDVAGYHENRADHAPFLLRKNRFYQINALLGPSPKWKIVSVDAMNDRGQIVARGYPVVRHADGASIEEPGVGRIVLLTPVLPTSPLELLQTEAGH